MNRQTDVIIIGAGPAGLSAAVAARSCGLDVAVVDEQARPGGQLYRNISLPACGGFVEEADRRAGLELMERFERSGAVLYPQTTVWGLEPGKIRCTVKGEAGIMTGSSIIVASGAMERPMPFPGWTLPGVMGAGAADILLRSGGTLTEKRGDPVVLAGNGPLLLLLAAHLLEHGVPIAAWLDTGHMARRATALPYLPQSLLDRAYLGKGLRYALRVLRGRVPVIRGVDGLRAEGDGRVERVAYTAGSRSGVLPTSVLLAHEGIIPRTDALASLGVKHRWDAVQRCWHPEADETGRTSMDGLLVTGDGSFVHGGEAALLKGTLTGLESALHLGVIDRDEARKRGARTRTALAAMNTARRFLKYLFAPNPALFRVPDDTVICRCEGVTAGAIRAAVACGYAEVNAVKRVTRCGMGPCQGRMCGPALAEVVAAAAGITPEEAGRLKARQPIKPVTLQQYCEASA